jgi:hypothetical protein
MSSFEYVYKLLEDSSSSQILQAVRHQLGKTTDKAIVARIGA